MPFLSVIIPVYNKGQYLNKCIQSIVDQSFTDWEMILIDDGSSDSSPDICDQWSVQDSRIKVIHQKNTGVSTARNIGIKLASGTYIQFTDADDWWAPDSFRELEHQIRLYSNPDILIFGLTKISNNKSRLIVTPTKTGKIEKKDFFSKLIHEQASSGIYGCVANKIISSNFILNNKLEFNSSYKLMEDYDFFLSAYEKSKKLAQSKFSGYLYLQETDNSTTNKSFVYNYPQLLQIRIKAYKYVKQVCGEIESNRTWLQNELNSHFLAAFVNIKADNLKNIYSLFHTFEQICPTSFYYKPTGNTLNTVVISFLLRNKLMRALYYYLKIRRHINKSK